MKSHLKRSFVILALWLPVLVLYSQEHYPKVCLMFASNGNSISINALSKYNLVVDGGPVWGLFSKLGNTAMQQVRGINPDFKGLLADNAGYVNGGDSILLDPGFREDFLIHYFSPSETCTPGTRATFPGYGFQVYFWNMSSQEAMQFRKIWLLQNYNSQIISHPDFYNGLYLDGSKFSPVFYDLLNNALFDVNCDGINDVRDTREFLAPFWKSNVVAYLGAIRAALPNALILCNDLPMDSINASLMFDKVNGNVSEMDLVHFYEGSGSMNWQENIYRPMTLWTSMAMQPSLSLQINLTSPYPTTVVTDPQILAPLTDYRRMRFGLASALMSGNHSLYALNPSHYDSNSLWFDEYDNAGQQLPGYLGAPVEEAHPVNMLPPSNLLQNGDFETELVWWATEHPEVCSGDSSGTIEIDHNTFHQGAASVKITPACSTPQWWQLMLKQNILQVFNDSTYRLKFWARAAAAREILVELTVDGSWYSLGLWDSMMISTGWHSYSIAFKVPQGAPDGPRRFSFQFGKSAATVWIDDVSLEKVTPAVYRRNFENGTVICNPTTQAKTILLGKDYRHILGNQDPVVNNGSSCTTVTVQPKDGIILLSAPVTLVLGNKVITGTQCFDALQTIKVAGDGTIFSIQNGGGATMIAGKRILYFAGTIVSSGGYLWGHTSPSGPWCTAASMPAGNTNQEESEGNKEEGFFTLYPNPTRGTFVLEFNTDAWEGNVLVDIYGMRGNKVLTAILHGEYRHLFSLSDEPPGIYLFHIVSGGRSETLRIVRE
ncbi:MAG: carbohydrate binding domain-containing protein [Bacteroidota bacterium]